ncbi:hypothetical protein ACWDOP_25810 [Nocardia sp. NPDC003693]
MRKSTVRRSAIVGGVAGVALVAALLAPAVANASEPDPAAVTEATSEAAEVARPGERFPAEPGENVLITKDRDGNVTVHRGDLSQLPPGAMPALPTFPSEEGTILVTPDGDHATTRVFPGDRVPGDWVPARPVVPAPSTGSAG